MSILLLTIISVVLYSLFAIFLSRMGGKINENLGAVIFMALGLAIPLVYYVYERLRSVELVPTTALGVVYAVLAGVSIAIWNVIVIIIFAKGGSLSFVYPVIYGAGAILIPTLVGLVFFRETVTLLQGGGLVLVLLGVTLIVVSKV